MSNFFLTCTNQSKQRTRFFFFEAGSNTRFTVVSPYTNDASGNPLYTPQQ